MELRGNEPQIRGARQGNKRRQLGKKDNGEMHEMALAYCCLHGEHVLMRGQQLDVVMLMCVVGGLHQ